MKKTNTIFAILIALAFAFMACESTNPGTDSGTDTGVEFGSISVTTSPEGASVFLDDVLMGVSPLVINDLEPGDYNVRATLDGYEEEATVVNLIEGSDLPLSLTLHPEATCPDIDLSGSWTKLPGGDLCDLVQDCNIVSGDCGFPPLEITGTHLFFEGEDAGIEIRVEGTIIDEDHFQTTTTSEWGSDTFDYYRH